MRCAVCERFIYHSLRTKICRSFERTHRELSGSCVLCLSHVREKLNYHLPSANCLQTVWFACVYRSSDVIHPTSIPRDMIQILFPWASDTKKLNSDVIVLGPPTLLDSIPPERMIWDVTQNRPKRASSYLAKKARNFEHFQWFTSYFFVKIYTFFTLS